MAALTGCGGMTGALAYFLDRYQAEVPHKMHSRDTAENGNPEWHRAFESWLTDGDGRWMTHVREDQEVCQHPGVVKGHCPTCDDSGLRVRVRHIYRHPAKRALERLSRQPVPKGRPPLDITLMVLADHDGDIGLTIAALANVYSFMWTRHATRWITYALYRFRAAYGEDAPARVLDRSQSQLDAEAKVAA